MRGRGWSGCGVLLEDTWRRLLKYKNIQRHRNRREDDKEKEEGVRT